MSQSTFEPGISRTEARRSIAVSKVLHFTSSSAALIYATFQSLHTHSHLLHNNCHPIRRTAFPDRNFKHHQMAAKIIQRRSQTTYDNWDRSTRSKPCPTLSSTNPILTVRSKPCPTLFSTNPTPTVLGLYPGLRSDRLVPQRLNHGWPSIMETRRVYCAEETEFSNTVPTNFILQRIN